MIDRKLHRNVLGEAGPQRAPQATPTLLPSEPDGHFLKLPHPIAHFKSMVGLHGFEPRKSETPDLQSGADCRICKNPIVGTPTGTRTPVR